MVDLRTLTLTALVGALPGLGGESQAQAGDQTGAIPPTGRASPDRAPRVAAARPIVRPALAPASLPAGTRARTVTDLLRLERDALQRILAEREELRRVRLGRRAAQGELLRLETVHLELRRRQRGVVADRGEREARLRRRLRALNRLVRGTSRRPLLDPRRSLAAADGRGSLLRIVRRDLQELQRLRREEDKIAHGLRDVVTRRREAVAVLGDLDRRKDALQARLAHCRQELSELRHLRQNHRGQGSEWNAVAFTLERQIVALHLQVNSEAPTFAKRRGSLVRPVPGMILTWFGQQRLGGTKATEESRGVEISALPTWKVRAPADGAVRYAGPVPGFGNVLVFDHDEGYLSLLGHLGALLVKVGDRVRSAQQVAGLPPPSQGGPNKVYLELRRSGRAFDPVPWILGGHVERAKRGSPDARRGPQGDEVVEREEEGSP